jgi:hypothetical protein
MRFALLLTLAAVIIGFVVVETMHSLLGVLLIIGGVGALFMLTVPEVMERFAVFLSTGTFRRKDWRD